MQNKNSTYIAILTSGILILAFCPPLSGNAYAKNAPKADQVGVFGLEDKSEAEDLGVEWTRQPLWWNTYENKKDKIDRMVKDLEGVKAVLTIRCVHPIKTVCPDSAIPSLRSQMSCPPRNLEEYKDFVRSVVRKYKDKVAAWQIENEVYATRKYWVEDERGSIEQFYPVFQAASEVIRQEDPGKPVLAPGIALGGVEFDTNGNVTYNKTKIGIRKQKLLYETCLRNVKEMFKRACPYFDVIDIHLYHTVESIPGRVRWLKSIMQEANCSKPIWSTEISGPQLADRGDADEAFYQDQAKELPVRLQAALDSGIEKVFYFHYRDGAPDAAPDIMYATLGLVTNDGRKKPAYKAMRKFTGNE